MNATIQNLLKNTKALIAIGVIAVIVISVIVFVGKINSTRNTMIDKETALTAQYANNQQALATYVNKIKEALGVANQSTAALDKVLSNAVQGRYKGDTSAQPGGGQLFSAITEAYPDITSLNVNYERVQSAVLSGRDAFSNLQTKMLDQVRDYNSWRKRGIIHSQIANLVGAPSDNLEVTIGENTFTGKAALNKMKRPLTNSYSDQAYETGKDEGMDLNPTPQPSPAP